MLPVGDSPDLKMKGKEMLTNNYAANRAVLRVLLYGWQEHELPRFNFKFKPKSAGSLPDVLSKFSSDIHFLIVAEDAVDDPTKKILSKGFYSKADACFFVAANAVKNDFNLSGHTIDNGMKNIIIYGFDDPLAPEIVPICRPTVAGKFMDVLKSPQFKYSAAVAVESRPLPEDGIYAHDAKIVDTDSGKRLIVLDENTRKYLDKNALYVEGQRGISYYILPYSTVKELTA